MNTEKLKQTIEIKKEAMIADLAGFIQIPSISGDSDQVKRGLEYILGLAEEMGFDTDIKADGRVGVISMGEGTETIGILTHVDVVPPGELSAWNSDPFTLTEFEGRLYGRGTIDDKGPIIACLYAMKAVKDCGHQMHKKVQLLIGTQEEIQWSDMEAYVRENPLPDYGFTPDGEFPICNIEKGDMDLLLHFPLRENVSEDGWYLTDLQAGTANNIVPEYCKAVLTEYRNGERIHEKTVEAIGKSVHSCQPEKGENAVFIMAEKLGNADLKENRLSAILQELRGKLSDVYGRAMGIYSRSEYYNGEFVHRNVLSPTVFHIEEEVLTVNVNIRFAYGSQPEEIVNHFRRLAEYMGGTLEISSLQPAVYVSQERPFLRAFAEAYEEGCGRKNQFSLEYGGTYAKAMPGIVSWGPAFPEEEDTCHEVNEYIRTDTLLSSGKIFAIALAKIVLSSKSFK